MTLAIDDFAARVAQFEEQHDDRGAVMAALEWCRNARESFGPHHPTFAYALCTLMRLAARRGQWRQADLLFAEAILACRAEEHASDAAWCHMIYGFVLAEGNKTAEARLMLTQAWDACRGRTPDPPWLPDLAAGLLPLWRQDGPAEDAVHLSGRAWQAAGPTHPRAIELLEDHVAALQRVGRHADVTRLLQDVEGARVAPDHPVLAMVGQMRRTLGQTPVFSAPPTMVNPLTASQTVLPADPEWIPRTRLLDLYEVLGIAGRGRIGTVYRVQHSTWNRELAVRRPHRANLPAPGPIADFLRDAAAWAALGLHDNVVTCYYFRPLDRLPCVFSDFCEGGTLQDWLRKARLYRGGTRQGLRRVLDIAIQTAWGLQYAHDNGLLHRNFKPANIFMGNDGEARVGDFGMVTDAPPGSPGATCSVRYCSMEQNQHGRIGWQTDIWSWALCVLEMFLGSAEWTSGATASPVLDLLMGDGEEALPLPPQVGGLLQRCLLPDPAERPASMRHAATVLREVYRREVGEEYPRIEPQAAAREAQRLNLRALGRLDLGRPADALAGWEAALALDAAHAPTVYNHGMFGWRQGQITDVEVLQRVCRLPRDAERHMLEGDIHMERGDLENANECFKAVVQTGGGREVLGALSSLTRCRGMAPMGNRLVGMHAAVASSLDVSGDGTQLLTAGWDGHVHCWDLHTVGGPRHSCPGLPPAVWWHGTRGAVWAAPDHAVVLMDLESNKTVARLRGHGDYLLAMALSTDERLLLTAARDGTAWLWDLTRSEAIYPLAHRTLTALAFSPDGQCAALGDRESMVELWDIDARQTRSTLQGHQGAITSVAWSPDGLMLVTAATDHTVRLWNARTGQCQRVLAAHSAWISHAEFGAHGTFLVSGSTDATIRLWDSATGRCLRTFDTGQPVVWVQFHPQHPMLLAAGGDGSIRVWDHALSFPPSPYRLGTA